ncbi:hypothetical protein [Francisella sp. TX07-6608]|uniref:hypothetical protein n=1 Tax=Francisella sp. TX07-6608 TaxID=573568 RepID=UPI0008F9C1D8|nr:hypothetical protein [Francisella sp. TX07-6608]OIN85103.1 hypothetical protein KX00_2169 [Francisella sp. TX07-6608]
MEELFKKLEESLWIEETRFDYDYMDNIFKGVYSGRYGISATIAVSIGISSLQLSDRFLNR